MKKLSLIFLFSFLSVIHSENFFPYSLVSNLHYLNSNYLQSNYTGIAANFSEYSINALRNSNGGGLPPYSSFHNDKINKYLFYLISIC